MTVSQMLESFFGKDALIDGHLINDKFSPNKIHDESGKEYFICGLTGKKIAHPIFVGTVYYMPLHHMVDKKCRSRGTGPYVKLTGQPTKGKQLKGGLRCGEMERDSIRMRDASHVLSDRLHNSSDLISCTICKNCGWLEPEITCCENVELAKIKMSRSSRLVLMEMYGLGIFPKLHIK